MAMTHLIALMLLGAVLGRTGPEPVAPLELDGVTCEACHVTGSDAAEPAPVQVQQVPPSGTMAAFEHQAHVSVACASCHVGTRRPSPTNQVWCDGCHHRAQPQDACLRCHAGPDPSLAFELTMELPGGSELRPIGFPHETHEALDCASCHGTPLGRLESSFGCNSCHVEHHETETVDCLGCHQPPPDWAHEDVVVHGGCSGAICHKAFQPRELAGWPRSVCEACHQDFRAEPSLPEVPPHARPDTTAVGKNLTGPSVQDPT